jgi:hypothetical protein
VPFINVLLIFNATVVNKHNAWNILILEITYEHLKNI